MYKLKKLERMSQRDYRQSNMQVQGDLFDIVGSDYSIPVSGVAERFDFE
jgi:hypothetical protein